MTHREDTELESVLETACGYVDAGLSVIPVRADGSKRPALASWKQYQSRRPTPEELQRWFVGSEYGIAVICGAVSGGLEVLDFDDGDAYRAWAAAMEANAPGALARLPRVQTPGGGMHVYYRVATPAGNQKLAEMTPQEAAQLKGDPGKRTLIETRGEGGYVLAPGSPAACHADGGLYRHVGGPPITEAPLIDERPT